MTPDFPIPAPVFRTLDVQALLDQAHEQAQIKRFQRVTWTHELPIKLGKIDLLARVAVYPAEPHVGLPKQVDIEQVVFAYDPEIDLYESMTVSKRDEDEINRAVAKALKEAA